jgi:hypothetical protein
MWVSRHTAIAPASGRAFVLVSQFYLLAAYNRGMSEKWEDPAKRPPKPETMNTPGDFGAFTDLMRKIVEKPKPASRAPAAS